MRREKKILLAVAAVLTVAFGLCIYGNRISKREICRMSSPDGSYTLCLYQIGSPQWSFGAVEARLMLLDADGRCCSREDFSLNNDGAGVAEHDIEEITWKEERVEVVMNEADTERLFTCVLCG